MLGCGQRGCNRSEGLELAVRQWAGAAGMRYQDFSSVTGADEKSSPVATTHTLLGVGGGKNGLF